MKPLPSLNLRIERSEDTNALVEALAVILALAGAILVSGFLIRLAGADPIEGLVNLAKGGFGGRDRLLETLLRSTPLILTGLATVIAFRGKIWTIGQEGQFFSGAMLSYWVLTYVRDFPRLPLLATIIVSGFLGGAILGLISGIMKAYFNVDIIISTVMLNYIINNVILMLLYDHRYWMDPTQFYPRTERIPEVARYPLLFEGYRLHLGFVMALLSTFLIHWLLKKTPLGFDIRALGGNPTASRFRGISMNMVLIITMFISGGLAGLAGTGEVFAVHHRLQMEISSNYGYTGIIVGMLAELNPLVTVLTAIFFGGLINGSVRLVTSMGIPTALIFAIQAIMLIFILAARALIRYRIRRKHHA